MLEIGVLINWCINNIEEEKISRMFGKTGDHGITGKWKITVNQDYLHNYIDYEKYWVLRFQNPKDEVLFLLAN